MGDFYDDSSFAGPDEYSDPSELMRRRMIEDQAPGFGPAQDYLGDLVAHPHGYSGNPNDYMDNGIDRPDTSGINPIKLMKLSNISGPSKGDAQEAFDNDPDVSVAKSDTEQNVQQKHEDSDSLNSRTGNSVDGVSDSAPTHESHYDNVAKMSHYGTIEKEAIAKLHEPEDSVKMLKDYYQRRPNEDNPLYKPGTMRRILGALAGVVTKNPGLTEQIVHGKYNKATEDWRNEGEGVQAVLKEQGESDKEKTGLIKSLLTAGGKADYDQMRDKQKKAELASQDTNRQSQEKTKDRAKTLAETRAADKQKRDDARDAEIVRHNRTEEGLTRARLNKKQKDTSILDEERKQTTAKTKESNRKAAIDDASDSILSDYPEYKKLFKDTNKYNPQLPDNDLGELNTEFKIRLRNRLKARGYSLSPGD